jgi:hypothetical protein
MAAAVLAGLASRVRDRRGTAARLSLARTAAELERAMSSRGQARPIAAAPDARDPAQPVTASIALSDPVDTPWGAATLLTPPFAVGTATLHFDRGSRDLGTDPAAW